MERSRFLVLSAWFGAGAGNVHALRSKCRAAGLVVALALCVLPAYAQTRNVAPSDSESLKAEVEAAVSGEIVRVPTGDYFVDRPLDVRPGVTVEGTAGGADRPKIFPTFTASDEEAVNIDNFANYGGTIQLFYANNGPYEPNPIDPDPNTLRPGRDRRYNAALFNVEKGGSQAQNVFRNLILNGRRKSNGGDRSAPAGIIVRSAPYYDNQDATGPVGGNTLVELSEFREFRGAAVFFNGGNNHEVRNSAFYNNGFGEGALPIGLNKDASSGAITYQFVHNSSFHNNYFKTDQFAEGFGIKQGGQFNRDVDLYTNTFELNDYQPYTGNPDVVFGNDGGTPNFDMEIFGGFSRIRVRDNVFGRTISLIGGDESGDETVGVYDNNRWSGVDGLAYGIEMLASRSRIDGNQFRGSGDFIKNFGGDLSTLTITNNQVYATSAFLVLGGKTSVVFIAGNYVELGASAGSTILNLYGGADTGSTWYVQDNVFLAPEGLTREFRTGVTPSDFHEFNNSSAPRNNILYNY